MDGRIGGMTQARGPGPTPSKLLSAPGRGPHYCAATVAGIVSSTRLTSPGRTVTCAVVVWTLPSRTTLAFRVYSYSFPVSKEGVTNTRLSDVEVVGSLSMVNVASSGSWTTRVAWLSLATATAAPPTGLMVQTPPEQVMQGAAP